VKYPAPGESAKTAVPFLLKINSGDNGNQLTVPGSTSSVWAHNKQGICNALLNMLDQSSLLKPSHAKKANSAIGQSWPSRPIFPFMYGKPLCHSTRRRFFIGPLRVSERVKLVA
jgi:hypothetical protein